MDLSVLIPSYHRADLLEYGLKSLSKQTVSFQYEILVLNDGIEDNTKAVCDKYPQLPIRYIFTGSRNTPKPIWRCPGYAINIGAKLATGTILALTCPEIYLDGNFLNRMIALSLEDHNRIVMTNGIDDRQGFILSQVQNNSNALILNTRGVYNLNTNFPFLLTINKQRFIDIGGYDEDFIGFCFDDANLVERLIQSGCYYHKINEMIIHLYHPRNREGLEGRDAQWLYNQALYLQRQGSVYANVGKDWGVYAK